MKQAHHGMYNNQWRCDGCGAVLGKVRQSATGGRYLDVWASVIVMPRNPYVPGSFMLACPCGHLTTWQGDAVNVRR